MITLNNKTYLTYDESADLLGVTKMTIRRWIEEGKLNSKKISDRKLFIEKEEIEGLLK